MADEKLTCCITIFNDSFVHYLHALLQSIDDVYHGSTNIYVYYMDISDSVVEEIRRKMPEVHLVPFEGPPRPDTHDWQCNYDMCMWRQQLADIDATRFVMFNTDMLLVKPLDHYFDQPFDIGFTYKTHIDENLSLPINSGMVLVRKSDRTVRFFGIWTRTTMHILKAGDNDPLWGGGQQDAFGYILGTRRQQDYQAGFVRLGCRLQGFTCRELNDVRRFPVVDKRTHILHYKAGWRQVLPDGTWTKQIPEEKGQQAFDLWRGAYDRWNTR